MESWSYGPRASQGEVYFARRAHKAHMNVLTLGEPEARGPEETPDAELALARRRKKEFEG